MPSVAAPERGVAKMNEVILAEGSFTLDFLAEKTGFEVSRIRPHLATLKKEGYVRQTEDGKWEVVKAPHAKSLSE